MACGRPSPTASLHARAARGLWYWDFNAYHLATNIRIWMNDETEPPGHPQNIATAAPTTLRCGHPLCRSGPVALKSTTPCTSDTPASILGEHGCQPARTKTNQDSA